MKQLAAQVKLEAVIEVIGGKKTLLEVSKKYGCTRQSLAAWTRKYEKLRLTPLSSPRKRGSRFSVKLRMTKGGIFTPAYRRGRSHPKGFSLAVEKQLLDLVVREPNLNIYDLAAELNKLGVTISASGVHKVLVRHNLQVRELRAAFSFSHPSGTIYASKISPANRKKFVEEYLFGKFSISQICRRWSVSRKTFYDWRKRYQEAAGVGDKETQGQSIKGDIGTIIQSLAKRYRRGVDHHNSIGAEARDAVIAVVLRNPYFSVHKIYEELKREGMVIGHAAIQNLLFREGLNTIARRLEFAEGFMPEPQVAVAPQYVPVIPVYKWRQLFAPFVTIPKLLVTRPKQGFQVLLLTLLPIFAVIFFFKNVFVARGNSAIGVFFASIALFFGLFFFVYSTKYYASILMVLKLAGAGGAVNAEGGDKGIEEQSA